MKIYDTTTHQLYMKGTRREICKELKVHPDTLSRARRNKGLLKGRYVVIADDETYAVPPSYTEMVIDRLKEFGNTICTEKETINKIKELGYNISSRFVPKLKDLKQDKGFWILCLK